MTTIITIRPALDGQSTVNRARDLGMEVVSFPMTEMRAVGWQGPDPQQVDALLIGSANAIRLGGAELQRYQAKPVLAVGGHTAREAQEAGFKVQLVGQGGLQKLLETYTERDVRLLRVAGARHVEIDAPDRVTIETRFAYEPANLPMPGDLHSLLGRDPLVLLHSAGSAEHFRSECERLKIDLGGIRLAAFGPRIADAAGTGWGELRSAEKPANGELLALAAYMCS